MCENVMQNSSKRIVLQTETDENCAVYQQLNNLFSNY